MNLDLPDYATFGASQIIKAGNQEKWVKTFTSEGISFESFTGDDKEQNHRNLARAIVARETALAKKEKRKLPA